MATLPQLVKICLMEMAKQNQEPFGRKSSSWGMLVRSYRIKAGLSQAKLAELTGVTPQIIGWWENSFSLPSSDRARRVADALNAHLPKIDRFDSEEFVIAMRLCWEDWRQEKEEWRASFDARHKGGVISRHRSKKSEDKLDQDQIVFRINVGQREAVEALRSDRLPSTASVCRMLIDEALSSKRIVEKVRDFAIPEVV